jgi:uncharacterized integral membrane protein
MKKLLYILLAILAVYLTAYIPYKYFTTILFGALLTISLTIYNIYDTRKKEASKL